MDLGLDDKVAIVTGGSRGIGRACAAALLDEGARVVIVGRDAETLRGSATQLIDGRPGRDRHIHLVAADLTWPDAAETVVCEALAAFDRIDVLVNNAGSAQAGAFVGARAARRATPSSPGRRRMRQSST